VELSWSTFVLELINFLVLVWILKRFLYQPVLNVIAQRKAGIEAVRAEAENLQARAEELRQQYEGRLAEWNRERQQARNDLTSELEAERSRRMEACRRELEEEREKARVVEANRQADAQALAQQTALAQGASFASRLLAAGAGADTQAGLVELVIAGLAQLPDERVSAIRSSLAQTPGEVVVSSAFALTGDQRGRLEQALQSVTGAAALPRFELDSELLAGVRINAGSWILGCNLKDELDGMTELASAG
jgi:F-type H+-transporting ATPase subunit b